MALLFHCIQQIVIHLSCFDVVLDCSLTNFAESLYAGQEKCFPDWCCPGSFTVTSNDLDDAARSTTAGWSGYDVQFCIGGLTIDVTGLNGYVTFLVKTPIWFIVCVSAAASTLQLLRRQKKVDIPAGLEWGTAVLAVIWVGIAVCVALFSGQASLGLGAILGVISAGVPLACLISSLNEPLNDESGLETDSENQV